MTFEQWGPSGYGIEDFSHAEKSAIKRMYTDWKVERVFYLLQNKDLEEANNSMGPKMIKLIEALENTSERTLADGTFCWCDAHPDFWAEEHKTKHSSWCLTARAVLAEVKKQG